MGEKDPITGIVVPIREVLLLMKKFESMLSRPKLVDLEETFKPIMVVILVYIVKMN